jgi:hypothetical protein
MCTCAPPSRAPHAVNARTLKPQSGFGRHQDVSKSGLEGSAVRESPCSRGLLGGNARWLSAGLETTYKRVG